VPLGNIYYYFKAKQSIGEEVILKINLSYNKMFYALNKIQDPIEKLHLFIKYQYHDYKLPKIVKYGCPIGSLSQEISKQKGALSKKIIMLVNMILCWIKDQFVKLGFTENSSYRYSLFFFSSLQGMCLLTNTLSNPNIIKNQSDHLMNWIKFLSQLNKTL
jgi:hypothetical protein